MPIEIKRSAAVAISTGVISVVILALVFHKDITWPEALGGLGLLLAPSIAKAKREASQRERKDDPPTPKDSDGPPPPSVMTPIMDDPR